VDITPEINVDNKKVIAIGIALQTQVLKTCPIHNQIYLDDDVDPASAFSLAIELVRQQKPFVEEFENDEHRLTDLLSDTLGTAPLCCPECPAPLPHFTPANETVLSGALGAS
jgi:hypothetical protein